MSKLSVIIPSLVDVDAPYMKLCVESLRSSGFGGDIIVVANGTKDMSQPAGTRGITKYAATKRQGQCFAVNRGVEMVEGDCEWILVSNSDMYYQPNFWDNMPDLDDPAVPLCFSPNLVEPSDNGGSAPPFLKLNGGLDLAAFKRQEVIAFLQSESKKESNAKWEGGFNLPFCMRIDVWRTIGGYDEAYDPWGSNSDTDLQTKVNLAGIVPQRLRNLLVYHFSQKSGTFDQNDHEKREAWWDNWRHYENKWGFNRDQLGSDVWYNQHILPTENDEQEITYQPDWVNKYAEEAAE